MDDLTRAKELASLAVDFDKTQQVDKAVECYHTAALILDELLKNVSENQAQVFRDKIKEYLDRAAQLQQNDNTSQEESARALKKLYFLMEQALDADAADLKDLALKLYIQALELVSSINSSFPQAKSNLHHITEEALNRAETLKKDILDSKIKRVSAQPRHTPAPLQRDASIKLQVDATRTGYTEEEKSVLRATSKINNNLYMPFMHMDLSEKFQYAIPFEDRDGRLMLSSKQRQEFDRWVRPDEICTDPKLIVGNVNCYSIKQTIVSDCSFVASLAVSALYERRFNKKIITSKIYPKNKNKEPIYNPFGKYMVKLHINGVPRKVIIDELLPYSKYGRLLCSYSNNKNELWVSILEKAYMKVMGGYDFPGSNSSIDLHALTGWLPERRALRPGEPDFNAEQLYELLRERLQSGHVLATVATGALADEVAERTGLVPSHAYAVLDVRLGNGVKLLKLKNPWSHLRWRGNYSEMDTVHWTDGLKRELNYDPVDAAKYDNGVFWIDYKSIMEFFDVFYLNWNPELFKYTDCTHQTWSAGTGPVKDTYNVGDNPQFRLTVDGGPSGSEVWLLLTRHITQIQDFRDNKEYITLLVYKNDGKRVYYPNEPPPYIDGVRINSPHYLCKLRVSARERYTLIVSQYEKTAMIYYTLRVYGTCPVSLTKLETFPHKRTISGEWSGARAGGCANHPTHVNNPRLTLDVSDGRGACELLLQLKGPRQYQLGIEVRVASLEDPTVTAPFVSKSSGDYRCGFVAMELQGLPAGRYIVWVSTFFPNQEGPFILEASCTRLITLTHAS